MTHEQGNLDIFRYCTSYMTFCKFTIINYDGEANCLQILPFYDCKFAKCHTQGI